MSLLRIISPIVFVVLAVCLSVAAPSAFSQQADRENYISLYNAGEYGKVISILRRETRSRAATPETWYYLGMAQIQTQKHREAVRSFERATKMAPSDARYRASLAFAKFLSGNRSAAKDAQWALKLDPNSADVHFVLGRISLTEGKFLESYDRASKTIEIDPGYTQAYILRAEALIDMFGEQSLTSIKPRKIRNELLNKAIEDIEKHLKLMGNRPVDPTLHEKLATFRSFSDYFGRVKDQLPPAATDQPNDDPNSTPIRILSMPKAPYTSAARRAHVSGKIQLLVEFAKDGVIRHILIIKPLGHGLDEQAVKSARSIKFTPATKDGLPISVVRRVEYTFTMY